MLDAHREHERTATSVLCHLASRVAVALHERHKTSGCEGGVVDRRTLRTQMREVMTHTTTTLHQLHLLLVHAQNGAVGVGIAIKTYHKAVAQRSHLMVVAYARHRTSRRNDIAEVVEQFKHLLSRHRVFVLLLDACHLVGYAPVHLVGRLLENISKTVLHGVFVHPHTGCQFIASKVL